MTQLDFLPSFATPLSYRGAPDGRRSPFSALARLSLVGLLASMTTGCLMEDPPPYTQPKQTPPRLDLVAATPLLDQIIVRRTGDPILFTVPVASEDAGDRLLGVLLLDAGTANEDQLTSSFADASTLDAAPRELTLSWTVRAYVTPGCHRFTLRVSHLTNFTDNSEVIDKKDVAEAYWWANLNFEGVSGTLVNCPLASTGEQ